MKSFVWMRRERVPKTPWTEPFFAVGFVHRNGFVTGRAFPLRDGRLQVAAKNAENWADDQVSPGAGPLERAGGQVA
jgi:hypothetical protein